MNEGKVNKLIAFCKGDDPIPSSNQERVDLQDLIAQRTGDEIAAVWTAVRAEERMRHRFIWLAFSVLDMDSAVDIARRTVIQERYLQDRAYLDEQGDALARERRRLEAGADVLNARVAAAREQAEKAQADARHKDAEIERLKAEVVGERRRANFLQGEISKRDRERDEYRLIKAAVRTLMGAVAKEAQRAVPDTDFVRCPECNSPDVTEDISFEENICRCRSCDHEWLIQEVP